MSGLNAVLTEEARRHGERHGLTMLPVLEKPFRVPAVRQVIEQLGLRRDALARINVTLADALRRGWLELWYQPKIDLRRGACSPAPKATCARVIPSTASCRPTACSPARTPDDMLALTQHVLATAMRDWSLFASVGVPIRFSINVPMIALAKLPLAAIVAQHRPKATNWPGLVLEISEDEIMQDLRSRRRWSASCARTASAFAIDDFGRAYSAIAQVKDTTFAELKIDRSFVANCDTDRMNAGLCETIIGLAHRLGSKAVAEGIETALELKALHRMGCDLGQGYLFARPMPRDHFLKLLRERGKGKSGA